MMMMMMVQLKYLFQITELARGKLVFRVNRNMDFLSLPDDLSSFWTHFSLAFLLELLLRVLVVRLIVSLLKMALANFPSRWMVKREISPCVKT